MDPSHEAESDIADSWPGLFNVRADVFFLAVVGVVVFGWIIFILHDLLRVFGEVDSPIWMEIFAANRPIEWAQWFVLVIAVVMAGFLSGKLRGEPATFFLIMAVAIALIFLEDASDLRHMLYIEYSRQILGDGFAGFSPRQIHDTFYSMLILVVPVSALARYWRSIRPSPSAFIYLIGGVIYYGNAVLISSLQHVDGYYVSLGEAIDSALFASRWPYSLQIPAAMQHWYIADALLRETVELLGAACFLAMILAYAQWKRETAAES